MPKKRSNVAYLPEYHNIISSVFFNSHPDGHLETGDKGFLDIYFCTTKKILMEMQLVSSFEYCLSSRKILSNFLVFRLKEKLDRERFKCFYQLYSSHPECIYIDDIPF